MEARTNDVCSRPVLISRQLTPHPHPQHVLGTKGGVTTEHRVHYTAPNQQPRPSLRRRAQGPAIEYRPPRADNHSDLPTPYTGPRPARPSGEHGVGHQSYGGHSVGETPGPIPNPEAKTRSADGTAPGRVWESRTPPDHTTRVEPPHHTVRGLPTFNTPVLVVSPPTTAYGRGPGPGDDEEEPCDGAG